MARIGLVLGGGGVLGTAFHAGVLTGLMDEVGWDARTAEIIVGTSAGAITAVSLRAGLPPADLADRALGRAPTAEGDAVLARLAAVPPFPGDAPPAARPRRRIGSRAGLVALARQPWRVRRGLLIAALAPPGRVPTDAVAATVDALTGGSWPDGDLWLTAVRLSDVRRVVFGRPGAPPAAIGKAVASSAAVPGFFTPVAIEDTPYVDGGSHSPSNLDVVAGLGLDLVVVSAPMSITGFVRRPWGLDYSTRRVSRRYLHREASRVRRGGTPVVAFEPTATDREATGRNAMDAGRLEHVAAQAYASTLLRLRSPEVRRQLRVLEP